MKQIKENIAVIITAATLFATLCYGYGVLNNKVDTQGRDIAAIKTYLMGNRPIASN